MHESALASHIFRELEGLCERNGWTRLKRVEIIVGALSGFQAESLKFCLEAIQANRGIRDNHQEYDYHVCDFQVCDFLVIEEPVRILCLDCEWEGVVPPYFLLCEKCKSSHVKLLQGKSLLISKVEEYSDV